MQVQQSSMIRKHSLALTKTNNIRCRAFSREYCSNIKLHRL
uniref:Uncharacterized protein n=1 Tax=Rhizophora mucronata TaxID=61149 RepID=A0A2P2N2U8_RHIMU